MEERTMKQRRAGLRMRITPAERKTRDFLRQKIGGVKSQIILGFYIADLIVVAKLLIIELDGRWHESAEQREYDARRTAFLEKCGFAVIRFQNETALSNPQAILDVVESYPVIGRKRGNAAISRANAFARKKRALTPTRHLCTVNAT